MRQERVVGVEELLLVRDIMAIDSLEGLGESGVFAEGVDDVLDLFGVELRVVDDCAIGVIGAKDTVGTKVGYTVGFVV